MDHQHDHDHDGTRPLFLSADQAASLLAHAMTEALLGPSPQEHDRDCVLYGTGITAPFAGTLIIVTGEQARDVNRPNDERLRQFLGSQRRRENAAYN